MAKIARESLGDISKELDLIPNVGKPVWIPKKFLRYVNVLKSPGEIGVLAVSS